MDLNTLLKLGVIIECPDINSRGSGFVIKEHLIGTNWHVVHDYKNRSVSNSISVTSFDGKNFSGTIKKADLTYDYAIIEVENNFSNSVKFGDFKAQKSLEEVLFVGKGLDVPKLSLHKGWISSKIVKDGIDVLQVDGPINQGNSGGPVFNKNGELIGIVTQTEAKIDQELLNLISYLNQVQQSGNQIALFGVNPLEVFKRIIFWLNRNRSVGIGYAFSTEYVKNAFEELQKEKLRK